MDNIKILKRLEDMTDSINSIESFVEQFPLQFQVFHSTPMYRAAVLYHIAILGEALNQILKLNPEIKISSARKIVNTRNYIIHGYDSLDDEILWSIVVNHLPVLKNEVNNLVANLNKGTKQSNH